MNYFDYILNFKHVMSDSDDSLNEDGPAYKISNFLFGNVNKKGLIEEYQHDKELNSINDLDRCRIKEVQQVASDVILERSVSVNSGASGSVDFDSTNEEFDANIERVSYYDQEEAIEDLELEQTLRNAKPEIFYQVI